VKNIKWKLPSEKQIESAILEWLSHQPKVFSFKDNTGVIYNPQTQSYRRTNRFLLRGAPDILVCLNCQGLPIFSSA